MHPMDRLCRYVGLDDTDLGRLHILRPHVEEKVGPLIDRFYAAILADEEATAVLTSPAQVERLKGTLQRWVIEMLTGPYDHDYHQRRERIGRKHVEVGLPHAYMFTAMNLIRCDLHSIVDRTHAGELAAATSASLDKVIDIELAIMLGTYMDEHERQELEGLRGLLVSNIPVTVFFLDDEGIVVADTHANPRLCRYSRLVGKRVDDVLHQELLEAADLMPTLKRCCDTGDEIVLPRIDYRVGKEPVSVRLSFTCLKHTQAQVMIYVEDLTDTVRSEARQQRAEHLARLGTMAATVAHEIRNPLAGMSSAIQVVAGTLEDGDPRKTALDKVRAETTRLGDLVGDLLSFSRPIAAKMRSVDLVEHVKHAIAVVEAAGFAGTVVEGKGEAQADPTMMGHVLVNLIQNAWQAGAGQVEVHVGPGSIEVFDDGSGIESEASEKLFEPFFTTKTRGTGLGLPMAKRTAEAMGGSLELVPSPLGGAGFHLRLSQR